MVTTAASRDRFVDLLRGGSILAVVLGHWLVADLRWDGAAVTETSALRGVPGMWPVTWVLVVIPLFFFVGGYSNRRSWEGVRRRGAGYAAYLDRRVHRVLAPTVVCVTVVGLAGLVIDLLGGLGVREIGGVMFQPLWFLGVYLWVVALAPLMLRLHVRHGAVVLTILVVLVALGDLGRFLAEWELAGYLNVLTVWLLMHQLGFWYADGRLSGHRPALMALLGLASTVMFVAIGPYPVAMVGVTGGEVGNMHPPTLAMASLGIGQIGLALMLRRPLLRWLQRPRIFKAVVAVNLSVMTIYLWHQPALTVAARLALPLNFPTPETGSPTWWIAHLAWLLLPSAVLAGFVVVFGRYEQVRPPAPVAPGWMTGALASGAVLMLGGGLLALAGSSVTEPWDPGQSLGPVTASPLWGAVFIAASALAFIGLRRTSTRSADGSSPASPLRTTESE